MLLALWILIGLFFIPVIYVSLGVWAGTSVERPREY